MRARILYRTAAVLLLLFAVGHTLGFRDADPAWGIDAVIASMQSTHFTIQGFARTYWDFFVGAGFTVGVLYLFAAVLAWQLGSLPSGGPGTHTCHCLGVRRLLCRRHGIECEVSLLDPDHHVGT